MEVMGKDPGEQGWSQVCAELWTLLGPEHCVVITEGLSAEWLGQIYILERWLTAEGWMPGEGAGLGKEAEVVMNWGKR